MENLQWVRCYANCCTYGASWSLSVILLLSHLTQHVQSKQEVDCTCFAADSASKWCRMAGAQSSSAFGLLWAADTGIALAQIFLPAQRSDPEWADMKWYFRWSGVKLSRWVSRGLFREKKVLTHASQGEREEHGTFWDLWLVLSSTKCEVEKRWQEEGFVSPVKEL